MDIGPEAGSAYRKAWQMYVAFHRYLAIKNLKKC